VLPNALLFAMELQRRRRFAMELRLRQAGRISCELAEIHIPMAAYLIIWAILVSYGDYPLSSIASLLIG
jgi:hypothetical protein